MGQMMETRYGAIDVTLQDNRTAYVRVGTGDRDDATDAGATLELPRGASASGRAHFTLDADGCWSQLRGHGLSRAGHPFPADLTPTMRDAANAAIVEVLATVDVEKLDAAQYAKNAGEASGRREQAKALLRMADQLNRQATELEMDRGSRVVYLWQRLRSGTSQDAIAVRTSAGELLFVDEPRPSVYGLRRWADEPAGWEER